MTKRTGPRIAIWDLPVRLVHWAIVLLVVLSWWTAEEHKMDWHRLSGVTILALLVFRLIWGFVGSSTARFASFVRGPRAVLRYARGQGGRPIGHNPLGGWSVVAMLMLLVVQVILGLFAVDADGIESGPLSYAVSFDAGRLAAEVHEASFNILLALIALHVGAILFHAIVRHDDLVIAMLTGSRRLEAAPDAHPAMASSWRAIVVGLIGGGVAWWIWRGAPLPA